MPEAAAGVCDDTVRTLQDRLGDARGVEVIAGMGKCGIGKQLSVKFNDKSTAEVTSSFPFIRQHQQILTDMASTYRAAEVAFRAQEESNNGAVDGSA